MTADPTSTDIRPHHLDDALADARRVGVPAAEVAELLRAHGVWSPNDAENLSGMERERLVYALRDKIGYHRHGNAGRSAQRRVARQHERLVKHQKPRGHARGNRMFGEVV